jgi:RNA polymerase sigma-54 factor
MIQSLKLLQINTLQLEQLIKTELEMNPVLEVSEDSEMTQQEERPEKEESPTEPDTALEVEKEQDLEVAEEKIDWEEYLEEGFDLGYSSSEESDPNREWYEPVAVQQTSLEEFLADQLAEKTLPEKQKVLVNFIIGCLDEDGYMRVPLDQIAEYTKSAIYEVEEALNFIWQMEPAGLGARTLQECLILQLRKKGLHDSMAMRILTDHWELFEKLKVPDLASALGVETGDIQREIDVIRKLYPKPGHLINPGKQSTIIPDLIVEKIDGKFIVLLNDRSVPMLHINRSYADMLKRGTQVGKDAKNYIREKFNSATWLIRSIEQRKATMLKVMYAIIEKQPVFFEKGPPNLNPLKLQDVADIIEMHISTVSRVTNNKYVQTLHGIYELKYFFTEGLGQDSEGSDISTIKIKNRLKEFIKGEDQNKPLSDQRLSELLTESGFKVARRTVAKYRELMKVLPARLRQKY